MFCCFTQFPLGKLKKATLTQGLAVLKQIELAIERSATNVELDKLSSSYYTLIPHSFGMSRPVGIRGTAELTKEIDLVNALGEIEIAPNLMDVVKTPQEL
jgi:poly [ADP-ribose] polymerase